MPGSCTPCVPLQPLVYGPAAPAPGQPGETSNSVVSTKERLSKTTIFQLTCFIVS